MNKKWIISLMTGGLVVLAFVAWILYTPPFDLSSYVPPPGLPAPFSYYIHPGRIIKEKYFGHHITVLYLLSWPKHILAVNIAGEWKLFKKPRTECSKKDPCGIEWEKETEGAKISFSIWPATQRNGVWYYDTWNTHTLKVEAYLLSKIPKELPPGLQP